MTKTTHKGSCLCGVVKCAYVANKAPWYDITDD